MESWVARRAQLDPVRRTGAEAIAQEAAALWNNLRAVLEQNVDEFNALYGGSPDRVAEFSGDANRAMVRLKARPHVFTEICWLPADLRVLCRCNTDHRSVLAAELRIFGDWDSTRVLSVELSDRGLLLASGRRSMDAAQAAEFILAPVLFPRA